MNDLQVTIYKRYLDLFEGEPLTVRSPGRINLIGEHTDYNDGFVMPAAIDKEAVFCIGPSKDGRTVIHSARFNEEIVVDLANLTRVEKPKWANYLLGVLYQIAKGGQQIKPFTCVFGGDVPVGAGLSSSAAIECGFAFALNELYSLSISKLQLITMAQWAEHHYAGVKCGIMDQFASVMGRAGHAIVLDCRSMTYKYSPIDLSGHSIVLCDTRVKHSLVDSEYNVRRAECEQGVAILARYYPQVRSLRDASEEMIQKHRSEFPGKVADRCLYVVREIARVQEASRLLDAGDLLSFGKKMYETHDELSSLYEVSCPELDFLVNRAKRYNEVTGARMMGGGFGGCTINLVRTDFVSTFQEEMRQAYRDTFGIEMPTYCVEIEGGSSVVSPAMQVMK